MQQTLQTVYDNLSRVNIKYDGLRSENKYTLVLCQNNTKKRFDINSIKTIIEFFHKNQLFDNEFYEMLKKFDAKVKDSSSVYILDIDLSTKQQNKFYYKDGSSLNFVENGSLVKLIKEIIKLSIK